MPERVSPTDRIRGHIDELFAQDKSLPEILEEVARLGAQLLMQAALEAEITEFLGRDRYQRATACEDARPGSRNGCREVTVKTTAGPVTLARPKLRGTSEAFASRLFDSHVTKTNALESLVIASFVRPVRPRRGGRPGRGDRQPGRDLQVHGVVDLRPDQGRVPGLGPAPPGRGDAGLPVPGRLVLPDAPRLPGRAGAGRLGITTDGKPAFIGLPRGSGESADAWHDFLQDLKDCGLPSLLLVISDGAPGSRRG